MKDDDSIDHCIRGMDIWPELGQDPKPIKETENKKSSLIQRILKKVFKPKSED